jgi:hypothetical protein
MPCRTMQHDRREASLQDRRRLPVFDQLSSQRSLRLSVGFTRLRSSAPLEPGHRVVAEALVCYIAARPRNAIVRVVGARRA